jgi:hypothetical protein
MSCPASLAKYQSPEIFVALICAFCIWIQKSQDARVTINSCPTPHKPRTPLRFEFSIHLLKSREFRTAKLSNKIHCNVALFNCLAQPDNFDVCLFVDLMHALDLLVALLNVFLVDTHGIDPEDSHFCLLPDVAKCLFQILSDVEELPVQRELCSLVSAAPGVGETLVCSSSIG